MKRDIFSKKLMFPGIVLFSLFSVSLVSGVSGQSIENKPLSEILAEIFDEGTRSSTLRYDNLNIVSDLNGMPVHQYLKRKYDTTISVNDRGYVSVPKNLRITNCSFESGLFLDSLEFRAIVLSDSEISGIGLSNCVFNVLNIIGTITPSITIENSRFNTLKIDQNQIQFNVSLLSLQLDTDLIITDNEVSKVLLEDLETNRNVSLGDNRVNTIEIFKSQFILPPESIFRNYQFYETNAFDMVMVDNLFDGDSASSVELRCNYTNLFIEDNQVDTDFYLLRSSVKERFIMVNNDFQRKVSFENFIFSETKNELYWNQFEGYKLAYSKNGVILDALTPEGFEDEATFKNLIATYKELHKIFLGRGDLESANACYSEMKELQGEQLRYIYDKEGGFNHLFRWMLNRLLKIYTNHGTDPALAVVISFYVIVIFAVFYFFFPSEWDKKSKMELIHDYRMQLRQNHRHNPKSLLTLSGIVFLSLLNALTLSLNSFVTLGFGTIPTRGVARYLCIIEGFMGWFLLSIFTVALINQVLA